MFHPTRAKLGGRTGRSFVEANRPSPTLAVARMGHPCLLAIHCSQSSGTRRALRVKIGEKLKLMRGGEEARFGERRRGELQCDGQTR